MSWISKHANTGAVLGAIGGPVGVQLGSAMGVHGSGPGQVHPTAGASNVPWEEGHEQFFSGAGGNDAEVNSSNYLNSLNPDQLLRRYANATQADVGQANGIYGTQDYNNYQAYSTFKSLLGRAPTSSEFLQVVPAFQGPNGHINGQAFLANLQQQYQANPHLDPSKATKAEDTSGSVQQQFKSILGRDATQDELSHFTQAIQSGQTDAYGLGSFLKQMPEYTNTQDTAFRGGLNTELQNYDVQEFGRQKQGIEADYARRGISAGSSPSLDYALTDLMGKIAQNRSAYLANLSASQYGGNKDLAIGNYQNTLNQMYSQNQNQTQNRQNLGNTLLDRGFQGSDYSTQMNDYMRMLNQGNQSRNVLHGPDWLNVGLGAINTGARVGGAMSGNPWAYLGGGGGDGGGGGYSSPGSYGGMQGYGNKLSLY